VAVAILLAIALLFPVSRAQDVDASPADEPPSEEDGELVITGSRDTEPDRGAGDIRIDVRETQAVQRLSAAAALTLAPGLFLTDTGGHPPQIFLRGFDARHGQDIQFTLEGAPLNQIGNPHGHGLTDMQAVIPETLASLRVLEGPFSPAQGDFAVAGSVEMTLGLPEPGMMVRGQYGGFNTARGMVGWQDPDEPGTLFAAELLSTDGFGDNRAAQRGNAVLRFEHANANATASVYATDYEHAGLVSRQESEDGLTSLYGTRDTRQGGSAGQALLTAGVHGGDAEAPWSLRVSTIQRTMTLRDNFTGFLLDTRRPGESDHDQRGDLIEFLYTARTTALDARAASTRHISNGRVVTRAGAVGRLDDATGEARRLRALDGRAYRTEQDYQLQQLNVALYGEGELDLDAGFTARMSLRAEGFGYQLLDFCAVKDEWFPDVEEDDVNCPDEDRSGVILRDQARTSRGLGLAPRGAVQWKPADNHQLQLAAGRGLRSVEAQSLSDNESGPFGSLLGAEAGYTRRGTAPLNVHRLAAFTTHVQRDLIFDEVEAVNVYGGETHRWGGMLDSEVHAGPFTERTSVTYTYAVFGDELPPSYTVYNSDRQPGMLIPYVPPWVVTSNLSWSWRQRGWLGSVGVAGQYVSPRPLPQSQRADTVLTVDGQLMVRYGGVELGLAVFNVIGAEYALTEYNFSSWFPDVSGTPYPSRVPQRQISPGAPRNVLATLTIWPEGF
jgi:hypothetical protein